MKILKPPKIIILGGYIFYPIDSLIDIIIYTLTELPIESYTYTP